MSLISIVVPARNEAENIAPLAAALKDMVARTGHRLELILVDDGSRDETWAIIAGLSRESQGVRGIRLSRSFGKEAAIAAGLDLAQGDAVAVVDADFQHPPSLLPEMIRLWEKDEVDIVEGVKTSRGKESVFYKSLARAFYGLMGCLAGVDLRRATDYKLMDKRVVLAWRRLGEKALFFRGLAVWLGFSRVQIPFRVQNRADGTSSWSSWALVKLAFTGITAFSSLPLHLVTLAGAFFFVFACILGTRALYVKMQGLAIDGITLVILLQLIMGSMLMLCLGVMGEYIARIFEEVKFRPRYIVSDKCNAPSAAVSAGAELVDLRLPRP